MSHENEAGGARTGAGQAVSRSELEKLQAARRTPSAQRVLNPDGMQQVKSELDRQREERIQHIETRLGATKDRATTNFALGQQRGVAKDAFERGR